MFGTSWTPTAITTFLLVLNGALFFALVLPYYVQNYTGAMVLIPIYLFLATIILLWIPSVMDPGIIPRRIVKLQQRFKGDQSLFFRINNLSDNFRLKF